MESHYIMSLLVLLFLMIVFSVASFYLAIGFKKGMHNSNQQILKERLAKYLNDSYSIKSWQSDLFYNKTTSSLNSQLCIIRCRDFLNNTEYMPTDAFVIIEENKPTCYCIYS